MRYSLTHSLTSYFLQRLLLYEEGDGSGTAREGEGETAEGNR